MYLFLRNQIVLVRPYLTLIPLIFINSIWVSPAHSAGFAPQSGSGLGNAFAGMAATSEDASNQSYNPASLSFLSPEPQISAGWTFILPNAEFQDGTAKNETLGTAVFGGDGGNASSFKRSPNLYLASEKLGKFRYGLSVTAPYGMGLAYDKDWMGRYNGIESNFLAIDINPALSYQLSERLSFGMGVSIQYARMKAKNAIDSSALCLYSAPRRTCTFMGLGTPGNAAVDSYAELKGNDISAGFNAGIIYKASPAFILGLAYRSGIEHDIKGNANFSLSAPMSNFLAASGRSSLRDTNFDTQIKLPPLVTLGVHFKPNDKWDILGDVAWTGWSSFKNLEVDFDNPSQPSALEKYDWENSWRFSLGANRRLNQKWKLRTGVNYDRTPISRDARRTVGIPDEDRFTLGLGLSHELNKDMRVEFGYAHLFIRDAKIRTTNATGHSLRGEVDLAANLVSFQLVRKF